MSFMSRLKGVFDVKTGQKGENLRKNAPKTAKFTSKKRGDYYSDSNEKTKPSV